MTRLEQNDELVWNLSIYGQHNIIKSLQNKVNAASYRFECDCCKRTIINIDDYENTVLIFALRDYAEKIAEQMKEKKDE